MPFNAQIPQKYRNNRVFRTYRIVNVAPWCTCRASYAKLYLDSCSLHRMPGSRAPRIKQSCQPAASDVPSRCTPGHSRGAQCLALQTRSPPEAPMQPSAAAIGQCAAPVVGCLPVCTLWTVEWFAWNLSVGHLVVSSKHTKAVCTGCRRPHSCLLVLGPELNKQTDVLVIQLLSWQCRVLA